MATPARAQTQLIVRNPRIQGGEPTIRGTRVPVRSIALARHDDGLTPRKIAEEFQVELAAVEAALAYYAAHKAEIDLIIEENERLAYGE